MANKFDSKTVVTYRSKRRGQWVTLVAYVPDFALKAFIGKVRATGGKILSA